MSTIFIIFHILSSQLFQLSNISTPTKTTFFIMKYTILIAAVMVLVQAAPLINNGSKAIPNSYIVVLKEGNTAATFQPKFNDIAKRQNGHGHKLTIHRTYSNIPGFAATINAAALEEILASDEGAQTSPPPPVITLQGAQTSPLPPVITLQGTQTSPSSWGLTRVSQHDLDLTKPYLYNDAAGQGITAYVIDTGVYVSHSDFGHRATFGANFVSGSADTDEHGHGTHVSGIIGGTKYGVAKKVDIVGVKVLDANGDGSVSDVIAGMEWVAARAVPGKSVVNMSLGTEKLPSPAINRAALLLYEANIPLIVAAGNGGDACNISPAGAPNTYTVAASDELDTPAYSTSYGSCVEIFAPGKRINSAWIGSTTANNTISGTSMASPYVAGVAALYLSFNSLPTAQSVFDKLTSTATLNKINGNLMGSPNHLVFNGAA
ncbi:subtilisin-like serine protease [Podila minutissima]|nr:subtilisin-like serine protease [Podila minutissima]